MKTESGYLVLTKVCIYRMDPYNVAFEIHEGTNAGQHETTHNNTYNQGNL